MLGFSHISSKCFYIVELELTASTAQLCFRMIGYLWVVAPTRQRKFAQSSQLLRWRHWETWIAVWRFISQWMAACRAAAWVCVTRCWQWAALLQTDAVLHLLRPCPISQHLTPVLHKCSNCQHTIIITSWPLYLDYFCLKCISVPEHQMAHITWWESFDWPLCFTLYCEIFVFIWVDIDLLHIC